MANKTTLNRDAFWSRDAFVKEGVQSLNKCD